MVSARERLAELRALRESGKTRLETYQLQQERDIFEEVDDNRYKQIVRERLDRDDFIVDDNGEGYADDGREDWMLERPVDSDSEEESFRGKNGKRKREREKEDEEKIKNGIAKFFNAGQSTHQPKKLKAKPIATAEDSAFMDNLLGEMDVNASHKVPVRANKKQVPRKMRPLSPPISAVKKSKVTFDDGYLPATPPVELDEDGYQPVYDDELPSEAPLPSSPLAKAAERKQLIKAEEEEDDEDILEVAEAVGHSVVESRVNISGARPVKKEIKVPYATPDSSSPPRAVHIEPTWNDLHSSLNVLSSPATSSQDSNRMDPKDALEEDGSLNMYWLDFTEVNGSLCLFGKVLNKRTNEFVSSFVKVDNILRKLYFLPRTHRVKHGRETDEEVALPDVISEVGDVLSRMRVGMNKMKRCTRKYAFELPGIPKEAQYLKVFYPYDKPACPSDIKGETFSHVFGTNTNIFEQFVLWKNIMGPCWLKIKAADFQSLQGGSWCKLEAHVTDPAQVEVLPDSENMEPPTLTFMSIAFRTMLNASENKQEIIVASARIYENVALGDTRPAGDLPCRTITVLRPIGTQFPLAFEAEAKKHRGTISLQKTEQALLSYFLTHLKRADPDVLIGHQLEGVDYSILLSRLKEKKVGLWHRIGRMKRNDWPKQMGKTGAGFFAERSLVAGRLLCDLANDAGKSMMTKCQSWSLTEMCDVILGNVKRQEIDQDDALKTMVHTREGLMNYVTHCELDTHFIAAIALKVQILPLTKQLTNLAGNSWARTLSGTRAERNEYILLHEFHRNKYICPDKSWGRQKQQSEEDDDEEEAPKKKDKYKGGLVFEPEKGLYDKFILVMDFNSLYPSIIQEYNICFTTVERGGDEDQVPEVPAEQTQGILPKLIATLVQRRRQVKGLMKDKRATPEQLTQWDIKQQALKLTANSMYGCLGYTRSRFYARPLAMLTTSKGREILRSTKELAESTQLQVVYGDTDSVMINTNMQSYEDAIKVGHEFKRAVNERYRLLEIDIDNIFRRLLLHAKKKYAAINITEIDGKLVDKLEVKGLDMRRREYCALSKEASQKLLNEILSGQETEVVAEHIHDYLRELAEKMREHTLPVQKYIIFTKLGKNPHEYPQADSMPQVQVALREVSRGKTVRANDVISYIITGDSNSSEPAPKRAYSPQDVMRPDSDLKPDPEWYLYKQIFPPVERLCAPIEGTDAMRIADCLGLDTRKYLISSSSGAQQEREIHPLESQIPEDIRFQKCERFSVRCNGCKNTFPFTGLLDSLDVCSTTGLVCPGCSKNITNLSLVMQLETQIRAATSKYYEGWLVCDDASCGNRTRQMSVYGHRCLGPKGHAHGCQGRMRYEVSDKDMCNQLLYFRSLWDLNKARAEAKGETKEKVLALAGHNQERFQTLTNTVQRYLDKCGRQWVAMDSLFGFCK